jgi:hypothetical protein
MGCILPMDEGPKGDALDKNKNGNLGSGILITNVKANNNWFNSPPKQRKPSSDSTDTKDGICEPATVATAARA